MQSKGENRSGMPINELIMLKFVFITASKTLIYDTGKSEKHTYLSGIKSKSQFIEVCDE